MSIFPEEETVLLSAISHFGYCPRRCALIHVDRVYEDNVFTLRGDMAHARVDEPAGTQEHLVDVQRALPVWSEKYGLYGKTDIVEFHEDGSIYPVEYKLGEKKPNKSDDMQICAQAVCLEEMFGRTVPFGAVFHSSSHARREVELTAELRRSTFEAIESIRSILRIGNLPPPVDDARCPNCSLTHVCMPSQISALDRDGGKMDLFAPVESEVME